MIDTQNDFSDIVQDVNRVEYQIEMFSCFSFSVIFGPPSLEIGMKVWVRFRGGYFVSRDSRT